MCDHCSKVALRTSTRRCCAITVDEQHDDAKAVASRLSERLRVVRQGNCVQSCVMVDGCHSRLDDRSTWVTVDEGGQSSCNVCRKDGWDDGVWSNCTDDRCPIVPRMIRPCVAA